MEEIDKLINHKTDSHLAEIATPCSVFMTFENEEGVNRALSMKTAYEEDPSL